MRPQAFVTSFFLLSFCATAFAQTPCNAVFTGTFAAISVNGGSCTLDGVLVTGSVSITNGGSLLTLGASQISGSVLADGAGNIDIAGTTSILGSLRFDNSPTATVTIGAGAIVSSLSLLDSGSVDLQGSVGGVSTSSSQEVQVTNGIIGGGGLLVAQGNADVLLCGATIGGSVSVIETSGSLITLGSPSCSASSITGSVNVGKGTGSIILNDAVIASGDLLVVDQAGSVEINGATLSDISINNLTGNVSLASIMADSDAILTGIAGPTSISGSTFVGDVSLQNNGEVLIRNSMFSNEDVVIKANAGPVSFTENNEVSVVLEENDTVEVSDNVILVASVTKNTGSTTIDDNTFSELSCVDNNPAPVGAGNIITLLASGQCASF